MRRRRIPMAMIASLLLTLTLAVGTATAARPVWVFSVPLTGAAEVPGPGDLDAKGRAIIAIFPDEGLVCYQAHWKDVDGVVTGGHIHTGTETQSGGILVHLFGFPPPANATSFPGEKGITRGCVEHDSATLWRIVSNPSGYYVNLHSAPNFNSGAIRGQLD